MLITKKTKQKAKNYIKQMWLVTQLIVKLSKRLMPTMHFAI